MKNAQQFLNPLPPQYTTWTRGSRFERLFSSVFNGVKSGRAEPVRDTYRIGVVFVKTAIARLISVPRLGFARSAFSLCLAAQIDLYFGEYSKLDYPEKFREIFKVK